jgi:hypothetical protein
MLGLGDAWDSNYYKLALDNDGNLYFNLRLGNLFENN